MPVQFILIEELSAAVREALPFIDSIVSSNPLKTATSVIEEIRSLGLGGRDQQLFNVIGQIKDNIKATELFNIGPVDRLPPKDAIGRAIPPLTKDYSYTVRIAGFNDVLGKNEIRYVTIASDTLLTQAEVMSDVDDLPDDRYEFKQLQNTHKGVVRILKSPLLD